MKNLIKEHMVKIQKTEAQKRKDQMIVDTEIITNRNSDPNLVEEAKNRLEKNEEYITE